MGKYAIIIFSFTWYKNTSLPPLKQCILFIPILLSIDTWLYRDWKILVAVFVLLWLFFFFTYFLFSIFIFHHNVVLGCVKCHIFILMRSFIYWYVILSREVLSFYTFLLLHHHLFNYDENITIYVAINTWLLHHIFGSITHFNLQRHKLSILPFYFFASSIDRLNVFLLLTDYKMLFLIPISSTKEKVIKLNLFPLI